MNYARLFLFYPSLMMGLFACAQSKFSIRHLYAVFQVHLPGNVAVDKNGNEIAPRDTVLFVYIETPTRGIHWQTAWENGKTFSINARVLDTSDFNAGTFTETNENLMLHAASGNRLWQLQLIWSDQNEEAPKSLAHDEILLRGYFRGKVIWERVPNMGELNVIPSQ